MYDLKNIILGDNVSIQKYTTIRGNKRAGSIKIGANTRINSFAIVQAEDGYVHIGHDSSINFGSIIGGLGGIEIGDNVRIASHVTILSAEHVFDEVDTPIHEQGLRAKKTILRNNVWIGSNVIVLMGITINEGAVVGAGSVVTKDVEANTVVAGVPAVVIKKRI